MKKDKLIKRTYRIRESQDKIVKKLAKRVSESEVIRNLIDSKSVDKCGRCLGYINTNHTCERGISN